MARISTYKKDTGLAPEDRLIGSSYQGIVGGVPKYATSSYTLGDLSEYFAGFVGSEGLTYDLAAMYEDIQSNITSLASVNISLTALADETQALAQADIDLQTQFTTDLSTAISSVNVTLTSLSNADLALASAVTNLETSFTTDLGEAVSTINTSLTSLSSENQALAQSITTLTTTVNNIPTTIRQPDEPDVNAYPLGTIWVDTDDNNSLYILAEGTPNFWQATTSEALGDLIQSTAQLQQDLYTLATDTSALALKTDTLTAQFGTYNPATNTFTFLATSDYFNEVKTYVDVDSALASEVTSLTATVETLDTDVNARIDTTNEAIATETTARAAAITTLEASIDDETSAREAAITTVSQAVVDEATARASAVTTLEAAIEDETSAREAAITSVEEAIVDESTARATAITTLEAAIEDEATARGAAISTVNQAIIDETTARTSADTTLSSSISVKPNVFRQASAPAVTEPVGSIWYDSDDGNKMYVLVAGTPRVWTETTDQRLPNVVTSAATATTNIGTLTTNLLAEATKITKLQAQYTFDGSGNVNGLADGTVVSNAVNDAYDNAVADADAAAATRVSNLSATISKIYKQASAPTGTIPVNSIWYDTDDSNKSYVYDGSNWIYTVDATRATTASVQLVSDAVGTINGKLVASHAITVNAGGKVAGLKLLADNTTSEISFQADKFKIFNSTSDIAPFVLDGASLKLNVPLNGVSGSFSGDISAASGTFGGALNVNSKFLVNSAGSVQIYGGDLVGNARFEILDDSGNSKYRLYGGGINLNSWTGSGALSGGKVFFGAVAELYSGNGTTVTTDHPFVINVNGGSKKLITRSDEFQMYNSAGGSGVILTVNGSIRATGNITAYYSSDKRLKENITPIENAIDKINSIGGYEFDWNDKQSDYEGHDIGVIAQEIQSIAPELVTERPDGYLAVKYEKLVAILVQGMKEQQAQIEELKNKIDGLTK